jgi:hypothetical protein
VVLLHAFTAVQALSMCVCTYIHTHVHTYMHSYRYMHPEVGTQIQDESPDLGGEVGGEHASGRDEHSRVQTVHNVPRDLCDGKEPLCHSGRRRRIPSSSSHCGTLLTGRSIDSPNVWPYILARHLFAVLAGYSDAPVGRLTNNKPKTHPNTKMPTLACSWASSQMIFKQQCESVESV